MSGAIGGMRGFTCTPNTYIYFNLGIYDSIVITCKGYRDGAVADVTYLIATASNFIKRISNGNTAVSLYKKDNSFCVYIPGNSNLFISFSWKASVEVSNILYEGYNFYSF